MAYLYISIYGYLSPFVFRHILKFIYFQCLTFALFFQMMLLSRDRSLQKLRSDTWGRIPRNLAIYRSDKRFLGNVGSAMRNKQVRWTSCKSIELVKKTKIPSRVLQRTQKCTNNIKTNTFPGGLADRHSRQPRVLEICLFCICCTFPCFLHHQNWVLRFSAVQDFWNCFITIVDFRKQNKVFLIIAALPGWGWLAWFNDCLALAPEVDKVNAGSIDLMTFWRCLQKSTKSVPEDTI